MQTIPHKTFEDNRGSYTPIPLNIMNINWTQCSISVNTKQFTLRGLHYQTEPPQTKYIKVVQGVIIDFMVDLTTNELDFAILSSNEAVFIPNTKAHGFLTLAPNTIVTYLVEGEYNPDSEHSIVWNSHEGLKELVESLIGNSELTISDKDKNGK